jgi:hypothetical protein
MDARAKRMELAPTAEGITAVFLLNGEEIDRVPIDPEVDDAAALAKRWLTQP